MQEDGGVQGKYNNGRNAYDYQTAIDEEYEDLESSADITVTDSSPPETFATIVTPNPAKKRKSHESTLYSFFS